MSLLLVSVLLFGGVTAWAIFYVGRQNHLTISQHVARYHLTRLWFGIVGTIAVIAASLSLFIRILPDHRAGILSYVIYAFIMLGFLVAALVPRVEGIRTKVHDMAAWGMCYLLPLGIGVSLTWSIQTSLGLIVILLFVCACVLLALLFTVRSLRKRFLLFQMIYLSIFFLFLLLVAYA